jgi:hypothetical protein
MVANTDKSRRIRDYYIAMEEVMFEYTKRKIVQSQVAMQQALADKDRMMQHIEAKDRQIEAAEAELVHLKTKTYEEIPKMDNVYVCKEAAQVGTDVHKIGKAINPKVREATFNTGSAQGCHMIYTRPTHNAKLVEDVVRDVMKRYHIGGQGGTEHYNNNTDHSIDVLDIACVMTDTLASSFEYMKRCELINVIISKLQDELARGISGASGTSGTYGTYGASGDRVLDNDDDEVVAEAEAEVEAEVEVEVVVEPAFDSVVHQQPLDPLLEESKKVASFVQERVVKRRGEYFLLKDARAAFARSSHFTGKPGVLKREIEKALGVVCRAQVWKNGRPAKNVFEGFALLADHDDDDAELGDY